MAYQIRETLANTAMSDPPRLRRIHHSGTEALISQYADGWHLRIDLKEPGHSAMTLVGFLSPTIEQSKNLADQELRRHGHLCDASCQEWKQF